MTADDVRAATDVRELARRLRNGAKLLQNFADHDPVRFNTFGHVAEGVRIAVDLLDRLAREPQGLTKTTVVDRGACYPADPEDHESEDEIVELPQSVTLPWSNFVPECVVQGHPYRFTITVTAEPVKEGKGG